MIMPVRLREKPLVVTLPCKMKSLKKARATVRKYLTRHGLEEEAPDVELAMQEALKNIIQHACPADEKMSFTITPFDDRLIIEVLDKGHGFDVGIVKSEPHDPMALRGRGIQIMKGLMDDVEISSGMDGTVVRMEKTRGSKNEARGQSKQDMLSS
ncbi:MAG: ATP-binding protein [Actinomycetota bacterium]|nr:ATP-binding protein [Actinomycetota bacterium]